MPFRLNSKEKLYFESSRKKLTQKAAVEPTGISFTKVYLSVVPFVALEAFAEWKLEIPFGGAFFPLGYLLFWAFFFTYWQPKALESKFIYYEDNFSVGGALPLLITALIWFIRFLVFDTLHYLLLGRKRVTMRRARRVNVRVVEKLEKPKTSLPFDLIQSLELLGLQADSTKEWAVVQKRYRELAKKFHPDLNPMLTQSGNRFMQIDKAYKKLESYRDTYFK